MLATDSSSIGEQTTGYSLAIPGLFLPGLHLPGLHPAQFDTQRLLTSSDSSQLSLRRQAGDRHDNRLVGTAAGDILRGRTGDDRLKGKGGNDKLTGDAGDDRLLGGTGADWLKGGTGRNFLSGNAGSDQLLGGQQQDQLLGGSGDDWLNGNGGGDRLTGGAGRDRFVLSGAARLTQAAQITDFKVGEDALVLSEARKFEDLIIQPGTGQQAGKLLIRNQAGDYLAVLQQSQTLSRADFIGLLPSETQSNSAVNDLLPPGTPSPNPIGFSVPTPIPAVAAIQTSTVKFTANNSEATIAATGAARIQLGTQTIYIGTQQVSSINQNPLIASFDSQQPSNNWVRTDYEVTGTDGRGYGLFWSGSQLYAVFSVDGTQGTPDQDFRRVSVDATQSWLRSYGAGGGAKVTVLARLDLATGEMTDAVYLSAILSNGNSNSLVIDGLSVNAAGNIVVSAQSYYAPRRPDGKAMTQNSSDGSPFDYELEITSDLKTVINTSAIGWS